MRKVGVDPSEGECVVALSEEELTIIIGGVWEALFELGDSEFRTRVGGVPADKARSLLHELSACRTELES